MAAEDHEPAPYATQEQFEQLTSQMTGMRDMLKEFLTKKTPAKPDGGPEPSHEGESQSKHVDDNDQEHTEQADDYKEELRRMKKRLAEVEKGNKRKKISEPDVPRDSPSAKEVAETSAPQDFKLPRLDEYGGKRKEEKERRRRNDNPRRTSRRSTRPPPSQVLEQVIPLNTPRAEILMQVRRQGMLQRPSQKMKAAPEPRDKLRYCNYHEDHGHHTEHCRDLMRDIGVLIKKGHLKEYIDKSRTLQETLVSSGEEGDRGMPTRLIRLR